MDPLKGRGGEPAADTTLSITTAAAAAAGAGEA